MFEFKAEYVAGTTIVMPFGLTKNDAIWNLTGLPVTFRMNRLSEDDTITKTRSDGIGVTDVTGEIEVTIPATDTDSVLTQEENLCEITVVEAGETIVAGRGRIRLTPLGSNQEEDE